MAKPNANYTAVESVPEIVSRLRKTFDSGKTKDVQWRKNQLKSLAFMVRDNERELCGMSCNSISKLNLSSAAAAASQILNLRSMFNLDRGTAS